jgi:hypothetical protein
MPVADREQFEVQPVELLRPQPPERDVAEPRVDVVLNDPAVAPERCRS